MYATRADGARGLSSRPALAWHKPPLSRAAAAPLIAEESGAPGRDGARLTVVVVAYVEREPLVDLLTEVLRQAAGAAHVMLVDNGLDADTVAAARDMGVHYVRAVENLGASGGRNLGTALVTSELVAFLDADGAIDEGVLDSFVSSMEDESTVAVRGRVLPFSAGDAVPDHYDLGPTSTIAVPVTEGVSVWRTAALARAGGFEDELYGGEGRVLCHRMIEILGHEPAAFRYEPAALLRHDFADSDADLAAKAIRTRVNSWHIARRYPLIANLPAEFGEDRGGAAAHAADEADRLSVAQAAAKAEVAAAEREYSRTRERDRVGATSPAQEPRALVAVYADRGAGELAATVRSVLSSTIDSVGIVIASHPSRAGAAHRVARATGPHVTVAPAPAASASAGWRDALAGSAAPVVACLRAGDLLLPTALEEAANVLRDHPDAGAVATGAFVAGKGVRLEPPPDRAPAADVAGHALLASQVAFRGEAWAAAAASATTADEPFEASVARLVGADWILRTYPGIRSVGYGSARRVSEASARSAGAPEGAARIRAAVRQYRRRAPRRVAGRVKRWLAGLGANRRDARR